MREEGYSANKASGQLNALRSVIPEGGDSIREKQKMAGKADQKGESCNSKGLLKFRVRNREFPSLFKRSFVNRSPLGLVFCLGYKY